MFPYIIASDSVTAIINARSYTARSTHPNFGEIKSLLGVAVELNTGDINRLIGLFDVAAKVKNYVNGNIEIVAGAIKHRGVVVNNYVANKILQLMNAGVPSDACTRIVKFLDLLLDNPSSQANSTLFPFLEHKNMPLDSDGHFFAYKGVRNDYKDRHTGTFDNSVGVTNKMLRRDVCDDPNRPCSPGFHAGSLRYASDWAGHDGHVMIVRINPYNVVTVPNDSAFEKLKVCEYTVVAESTNRAPLSDTITDDYAVKDTSFEKEDEDYDAGYEAGVNDGELAKDNGCYSKRTIIAEAAYPSGYNDGYNSVED